MTLRRLNATAASLLGFLHDGPLSGYELAATAERAIGDFWSVTQSQIYRELSAMAEAGLVEPGEREARDRRRYALTDAGRAAFREWVNRPPGPETIRHSLLLTVRFGRHLAPERLATFLRQHRDAHAEKLRAYEEQTAALAAAPSASPDPYEQATLAFGIAYERAALDWFVEIQDVIPAPPARSR